MAYNQSAHVNDKAFWGGQLVDISTSSISYAPIPFAGVIVSVWSAISAAITTADGVITVSVKKNGGVSTTLGTITIATASSAPGDVDEIAFAVTGASEQARSVGPGDTLICNSSGACDTTCIGNFTAVIRAT